MKFQIEQIALCPHDIQGARELLTMLGLKDWTEDVAVAAGHVHNDAVVNTAELSFNYEAAPDAVELEVLHYTDGGNWMTGRTPCVSHLGMHVTEEELVHWRAVMADMEIPVAQEVITKSHTNPHIANSRRYHYVIFATHKLIGVDLKFIVRMPLEVGEDL